MAAVWIHNGCDGRVFWDLSGGFCTSCWEENLTEEDATKGDGDE